MGFFVYVCLIMQFHYAISYWSNFCILTPSLEITLEVVYLRFPIDLQS